MENKDWGMFVLIALDAGWKPEHIADFIIKALMRDEALSEVENEQSTSP